MVLNQVIYISLGLEWNRRHRPVLPQRWGADQRNCESKLGINVLQNHLTNFKSFFKIQILFFLRKRRKKCQVPLQIRILLCPTRAKHTLVQQVQQRHKTTLHSHTTQSLIDTQRTTSQTHITQLHRHTHNSTDTQLHKTQHNFIDTQHIISQKHNI